jgi:hypothetical protein
MEQTILKELSITEYEIVLLSDNIFILNKPLLDGFGKIKMFSDGVIISVSDDIDSLAKQKT